MPRFLFLILVWFAFPQFAQAAWHEASSDHFLIYANQSEKDVLEFSSRLERYHNAMEGRLRLPKSKPSPSNRVTVYVLRDKKRVRKLAGKGNDFLSGFYSARAGGSVAFVPRVDSNRKIVRGAEGTLLHEYAHHFLISQSAARFPRWYSEGFAEFYSAAKFEKDGSVGLGLPAYDRANELVNAKDVPIELLLDTQAYRKNRSTSYDNFYGKSWLLIHYLSFSEPRKGQLRKYMQLLQSGSGELDAAKAAFGNLKTLDKELSRYMKQRRQNAITLSGSALAPGPIAIRKLSAGEAAMMPVKIQSKRGVNEEQAKELLPDARKIASKYPDDPAVLSALAEAEFDAENFAEAITMADRAIAIDPGQINAMLQKGYAMRELAKEAEDAQAAWNDVRKQFIKINRLENDHPIPLIHYYRSFRAQGKKPPEIAVQGLERALELSPFDRNLRLRVARRQMREKRYADTIDTLTPLANSPHKSKLSDKAGALLQEATSLLAEQK